MCRSRGALPPSNRWRAVAQASARPGDELPAYPVRDPWSFERSPAVFPYRAAANSKRMGDLVLDGAFGSAKTACDIAIAQALETMQHEHLTTTRRQRADSLLDQPEILPTREQAVRLRLARDQLLAVQRTVIFAVLHLGTPPAIRDHAGRHMKKQRPHFAGIANAAIAQHAQAGFLH